jgi:predicted AAA+ superfamily ATPase
LAGQRGAFQRVLHETSKSAFDFSNHERSRPHLARVRALFDELPVVAVLGQQQVGKTTLVRRFAETVSGPVQHFDLEHPADPRALQDPMRALEDRRGVVVIRVARP